MSEDEDTFFEIQILLYLLEHYHSENYMKKQIIQLILFDMKKNKITIAAYICDKSQSIIKNIISRINSIHLITNKENPFKIISSFFDLSTIEESLKYIKSLLKALNKYFDKYYLREDIKTISYLCPIYMRILLFLSEISDEKIELIKVHLETSNSIRQVLLRIKPFILHENRTVSVQSLHILKASCKILSSNFLNSLN